MAVLASYPVMVENRPACAGAPAPLTVREEGLLIRILAPFRRERSFYPQLKKLVQAMARCCRLGVLAEIMP